MLLLWGMLGLGSRHHRTAEWMQPPEALEAREALR
jgi:hypothetical protein